MKGNSRAITGVAALFMAIFGTVPAMADSADAVGRWATPAKHGVVDIALCGASVCGRLIESDSIRADANARDTKNSDPALRSRPLRGLTLLAGFRRARNGWDSGTIYNPEDGGTYHATITLSGRDTLFLKGCVIWPLCKSQTWHRIP
jgi:uncharacterized protein (DUF2147 family)